MLSPLLILSSLALSTRVAFAQIDTFRGTIEGALHQCQDTGIFFFDSGGSRPLDVLFLPSSSIPDPLRAGTTTLDDAIKYNPLLAISGITTPDASQFDFTLQVATGQVFEIFAFLPDGQGKALNLTRTVMTPLPSASACLTNVVTTIPGAGVTTSAPIAATTTTSVTTTAKATTPPKVTTSSRTSSPTSVPISRSTSSSSLAAGASTSSTSDSLRSFGITASVVVCFGASMLFGLTLVF